MNDSVLCTLVCGQGRDHRICVLQALSSHACPFSPVVRYCLSLYEHGPESAKQPWAKWARGSYHPGAELDVALDRGNPSRGPVPPSDAAPIDFRAECRLAHCGLVLARLLVRGAFLGLTRLTRLRSCLSFRAHRLRTSCVLRLAFPTSCPSHSSEPSSTASPGLQKRTPLPCAAPI